MLKGFIDRVLGRKAQVALETPKPARINLAMYRDLLRPGLRQLAGDYHRHLPGLGPVDYDMWVSEIPRGIGLKSINEQTGVIIESFIPEAEFDGMSTYHITTVFKEHCAIIFPLNPFPDEAVVGYDC